MCLSILLIPHIYPSLSLVLNCLIPSLHTQFIILFPLLSSPCIGFRRARNLFKAAHINKHPGYNINQVGTFYHLSQQAVDSPELDILKSNQKEKLSQILTAYSDIHFESLLGSGGYGSVFKGRLKSEGDWVAVKLEVLDRTKLDLALEREAKVYNTFSPSCRAAADVPVPKTFAAFRSAAGKNSHFFASVLLDSEVTANLLCLELLDTETPAQIWKDAKQQLHSELEVTAPVRYLILEFLHALLYYVRHGIAIRDFKAPHHVGYRNDGQLVVFDMGLAEVVGYKYQSSPTRRQRKITKGIEVGIEAVSVERTEPRHGQPRPGTHGYRAPFKADTQDLGHFADIWSAAVSIVKLVRECPKDDEGRRAFEKSLYDVIRKEKYEDFEKFALEGWGDVEVKDSCRRLLKLAYMMFQSTPFDKSPREPPDKALIAALFSEFALCSIYEEKDFEMRLREEGIVIDGKIARNGKIQRPVLLILDRFGLMILSIFKCNIGDLAGEYCGRVICLSSGTYSSESFSLHSVTVSPGLILNGAPCKALPLRTLMKGGVASLFLSSRQNPGISTPGNVGLVDRLKARSSLEIDGIELESIPMFFRENVDECTLLTWDYNWANAQHPFGMSEAQIRKAMESNSPNDMAEIEGRWRSRVMEHKARLLLDQPPFTDAIRGTANSNDGAISCTLLGDCFCDSCSINPVLSVDCRGFSQFIPSVKPLDACVWGIPPMISDSERLKLTFEADDPDFRAKFWAAQEEFAAAIVQGFDRIFPDELEAAVFGAEAVANENCGNDVFMLPGGSAGKKRKKLGYIGRFPNAPATYMCKCMEYSLPDHEVAIGTRIHDVKKPAEPQCELIRELPAPEDEEGEVQAVHVDCPILNPKCVPDCMNILRANLQCVMESKGPLSLFFPLTSGYSLVVFLTAHKPAIECLKNFARHYEPARTSFKEMNPRASDKDWLAAWCGCTIRYLRKRFPDQQFKPVCIPVQVGEMLAISSFLPHCGVPVEGIRGFIAATYKVPTL